MAFKSDKFELVELIVQGTPGGQTQTRFNFPDLPKLRFTNLQAITVFTDTVMPYSPSGYPLFTTGILNNTFATFYANEKQDLYRIPLLLMNNINDYSNPFQFLLFEFKPKQVTWDKSYLELASGPNNTSATSFVFGVYYS